MYIDLNQSSIWQLTKTVPKLQADFASCITTGPKEILKARAQSASLVLAHDNK